MDTILWQDTRIQFCDKVHLECKRSLVQCLLLNASSTLALSEMNANIELYMQIWSRKLTTLFFFLVKRISSSCGVARRLGNRTLPFLQHRKNCGLLLFNFANRSLIHIFTLQNPHIVSISPQSHRAKADASSSPNNYNVSLPTKGYARAIACCTIRYKMKNWKIQTKTEIERSPWSLAPNNLVKSFLSLCCNNKNSNNMSIH